MIDDPIVEEVRNIRRQMMTECGNDVDAFEQDLLESQKRHKDRLVRRGPRRIAARKK